jgi:hypothetical protein
MSWRHLNFFQHQALVRHVVKPNDWVKAERAQQAQNSPEAVQYLTFWTALKDWMESHRATVQIDRPTRTSNIWIPIVGTQFVLSVFRAKGRVGLFVRPLATEASADGQNMLKLLETLRPAIIEKLSLGTPASVGPKLDFSIPCNADDQTQWASIFERPSAQIERYSNALREVASTAT